MLKNLYARFALGVFPFGFLYPYDAGVDDIMARIVDEEWPAVSRSRHWVEAYSPCGEVEVAFWVGEETAYCGSVARKGVVMHAWDDSRPSAWTLLRLRRWRQACAARIAAPSARRKPDLKVVK